MDIPKVPTSIKMEPRSHVNLDHQSTEGSSLEDGYCGEPFSSQCLRLDFTPREEDTEFLQKKCCAFWDFIRTVPELQRLKVLPEDTNYTIVKAAEPSMSTTTCSDSMNLAKDEKTGVSVMETAVEKGLLDGAFETELCQSLCTLGSREYREGVMNITQDNDIDKAIGASTTARRSGRKKDKKQVKKLCDAMEKWDESHPKSMEPPGHPPSLQQGYTMQKSNLTN